jgi:hypothetical protein
MGRSKGAHWRNLLSRGTMVVWEVSGERGSDSLRGKARGEVNIGVDEVKRREEQWKVGLAGITLCKETGAVLGAPHGRKRMGPKGLAGLNRAVGEMVGLGDMH